ncbi:hypothetical protein BDN72DRAFT_861418 [Pluteus cervinus]|uniref:Uncharacterized protein n=1 Tax=Pluteus cervinus TaxID=181527 RepID=A0ACD3AG07_9AGAR|nr:hypothetical protein BDN72DRAFT_861418 [Pluteus cervinus]
MASESQKNSSTWKNQNKGDKPKDKAILKESEGLVTDFLENRRYYDSALRKDDAWMLSILNEFVDKRESCRPNQVSAGSGDAVLKATAMVVESGKVKSWGWSTRANWEGNGLNSNECAIAGSDYAPPAVAVVLVEYEKAEKSGWHAVRMLGRST